VIFFALTVLLVLAIMAAVRYVDHVVVSCLVSLPNVSFPVNSTYMHTGIPNVATLKVNNLKSL
jgi:hypothetical protein